MFTAEHLNKIICKRSELPEFAHKHIDNNDCLSFKVEIVHEVQHEQIQQQCNTRTATSYEMSLCNWIRSSDIRRIAITKVGADWLGLTALSAQIGNYIPLISMLQLKEGKFIWQVTMLHVGNTYNKPLQSITLQSGFCRGNPSTRKISWE